MDVNYKNQKRYKTAKYPIRQPRYLTWLIWILSKIMLANKKKTITKIGMDDLKGPYMLLSNHMSFIDFELVALATHPRRVNNVVNIDGYYRRPWLLEWIGAICTRKFTADFHLVKSIHRVLQRGDILCMYPEARYSPAGITSYLPDTLGALIKRNRVPVVVAIHHGNYLHAPFWNFRRKRKVPLHTTFTKIFDVEDCDRLSVEQINERLREAFIYDEYQYQKENGILITEPLRAEGMHKILYQCPACGTEHQMASKGCEIFCTACGKRWRLGEDGTLSALNGETEFSRVPDWFLWEREQVKGQIERSEYHFEDEVDVHSMPRCWRFEALGKAKLTHNAENGFVLEGYYRDAPYTIKRAPLENNSLHVEYDFPHIKPYDCIDLSTANDSFYCFPTKENVVTKLAFATEIIYLKHLEQHRSTLKKGEQNYSKAI